MHKKFVMVIMAMVLLAAIAQPAFSETTPKVQKEKKAIEQEANGKYFLKDYKSPVVEKPQSLAFTVASFMWQAVKFVFIFVFVLGIAYLAVFLSARLTMFKAGANKSAGIIKVLETTYVGPNKILFLVGVSDSVYLLSSSQNSINLIATIDDNETVKEMYKKAEANPIGGAPNFPEALERIFDKLKTFRTGEKTDLATSLRRAISNIKGNIDEIGNPDSNEKDDV